MTALVGALFTSLCLRLHIMSIGNLPSHMIFSIEMNNLYSYLPLLDLSAFL